MPIAQAVPVPELTPLETLEGLVALAADPKRATSLLKDLKDSISTYQQSAETAKQTATDAIVKKAEADKALVALAAKQAELAALDARLTESSGDLDRRKAEHNANVKQFGENSARLAAEIDRRKQETEEALAQARLDKQEAAKVREEADALHLATQEAWAKAQKLLEALK